MDRQTRYKVLEEIMEGSGPAAREAAKEYERMQAEDLEATARITEE